MHALSTALICLASLINLGPLVGALSSKRLQALYGIKIEEPNLSILMRHRAVLFGIVGTLLAVSAFYLPLRPPAYAAGIVSMLSFVLIARLVGGSNAQLKRIVTIDLVGSAALLGALLIDFSHFR